MKKTTYLICLFLLSYLHGAAKTYTTVHKGYWFSSFVWQNNIVPPYSSSDTIIIKHLVNFDKNLFLNSGAYMLIDTSGGLCGHHNITVFSNARLHKYGLLQLDSMLVTGGKVVLNGPKDAVFSLSAILTVAGADMLVSGCKLSVGPWFECTGGDYESSFFKATYNKQTLLYPNPNNGRFTLFRSGINSTAIFKLMDMNGRVILEEKTETKGDEISFNISALPEGIYYWQLIADGLLMDKGKMSVVH